MPTSGTVLGNNANAAGNEGAYLDWQLVSQNEETNKSLINWQAGWRFVAVGCRGLRSGGAVINGTLVYWDMDPGDGVHNFVSGHNHRPKLQTASGSIEIEHNEDGTKTFTASVALTGWDGGGPNADSFGEQSFELPTIARLSSAPSTPVLSSVTSSSMIATFTDGTGGAAIDSRQLAYGTSNNVADATIISSDGSDTISGLASGTTYYVWARTHNAAGYSPWSGRANATTLGVPEAPSQPVLSNVTQTSATVTWSPNGSGGTPITSYELRYGTDPSGSGATIVTATSPYNVTDLSPGQTYYFWVRAINAVGTSAWSIVANSTSIAGVRIKYAGVWKHAIPYVRDAGVWKLARPWMRYLGTWKETV